MIMHLFVMLAADRMLIKSETGRRTYCWRLLCGTHECRRGGMVDATDLKSVEGQPSWGFESPRRHMGFCRPIMGERQGVALRRKDRVEHFEAAAVLFHRADRDADPVGQFVAAHRAHDHALLEHVAEDAVTIAGFDQEEVGVTGNEFERARVEGLFIKRHAFGIHFFRLCHVRVIGECGHSTGLGDGIDIEGLTRFLQQPGKMRWRDAISDTQCGESVDF